MIARNADALRRFAAGVAETLQIADGESVFEVGCGAGALLHSFHQAGCRVGGMDPSAGPIAAARDLMPQGQWLVGEASALDPAEPYAVVLACGAFERFPDHEYARGVLARMAAKATRAVAILDVLEAGADGSGAGAGALRFERLWFLRVLDQIGASAVQIGPTPGDSGSLAEHRYHVLAKL